MITKIISGGQWGADIAGLASAVDNNIPTGGYAPKGWKTIYGSNYKLKFLKLQEHESYNYPPRTYLNVKESDGTIRFAFDFNSAGEKCTLKAIKLYSKPHIDINLNKPRPVNEVAKWIKYNHIHILNVAGNAGKYKQQSNTIFIMVRSYMNKMIKCLKESNK